MDRSDLLAPSLTDVIDGRLHVLRGGADRHEDGVGVVAVGLTEQPVVAPRQLRELLVGIFQEPENRLHEVVSSRRDPLHIVLLVLHRPQKHRVPEIDPGRHASPRGTEDLFLRLGWAIDGVVWPPEELPNQPGLGLREGTFQMRGQKSVLPIDPGRERELVDPPQNERLIRRLLGVFSVENRPARIESHIDVVVPAVHVECVLRNRARRDLEHHRRELARRVVVLLDSVGDPLARGEVDHAPAGEGVGDRAALSSVLPLGLDRDLRVAEDVQLAQRERELEALSHLGGRRNRIENPGVCEPGLGVVGDKLIPVGRDGDPRILGSLGLFRHTGWSRHRSHPRFRFLARDHQK